MSGGEGGGAHCDGGGREMMGAEEVDGCRDRGRLSPQCPATTQVQERK